MLSNSIALIAVAAMFGVEAYKAKERLPRLVLATLAVVSALWGVLVEAIAAMAPKVGAIVTATFAQPSSWFVLLIALFFVLRPFWQSKVATPSASAAPASGQRGADSGEIENLKKRLSIEQDRSALTIARVEKLEGLPERVDALEALPATVGEMRVALENDIEALRAVANDSALQIQRIHPYLQEQARTLNERFSAVGDYVRLVTLEPEIRQYAASLDTLFEWRSSDDRRELAGVEHVAL